MVMLMKKKKEEKLNFFNIVAMLNIIIGFILVVICLFTNLLNLGIYGLMSIIVGCSMIK